MTLIIIDTQNEYYSIIDPNSHPIIFDSTIPIPAFELGIPGPPGPIGPSGPQGIQGLQGPQGIQGPTGLQGLQGVKGDQGNQGLQGNQGPQGPVGSSGPKGDKGDKGDEGDKGDIGTSNWEESGLIYLQPIVSSYIVKATNGIEVDSILTINDLAGIGERNVGVDADGNLIIYTTPEFDSDQNIFRIYLPNAASVSARCAGAISVPSGWSLRAGNEPGGGVTANSANDLIIEHNLSRDVVRADVYSIVSTNKIKLEGAAAFTKTSGDSASNKIELASFSTQPYPLMLYITLANDGVNTGTILSTFGVDVSIFVPGAVGPGDYVAGTLHIRRVSDDVSIGTRTIPPTTYYGTTFNNIVDNCYIDASLVILYEDSSAVLGDAEWSFDDIIYNSGYETDPIAEDKSVYYNINYIP